MINSNEITINGVVYVEKSKAHENKESEKLDGLEYVVVRGDRSGVFAGYLESHKDREVILRNCRRLWYWSGAASLSQLAIDGVSKPEGCKFTVPVKIKILDAIEILETTLKAQKSIKGVAEWKA